MASSIMSWVKQIALFYIASNIFIALLPGEGYKKQIKVFVGIILILIVINPILSLLGNEKSFDSLLNAEISKSKQDDNIIWMKINDESQYEQVIQPYIDAIKKDIDKKAWEYALYVDECSVFVDTDQNSGSFGKITGVDVKLSSCIKESGAVNIDKIEKIEIETAVHNRDAGGGDSGDNGSCAVIKEYISTQYGVDSENVIVRLE